MLQICYSGVFEVAEHEYEVEKCLRCTWGGGGFGVIYGDFQPINAEMRPNQCLRGFIEGPFIEVTHPEFYYHQYHQCVWWEVKYHTFAFNEIVADLVMEYNSDYDAEEENELEERKSYRWYYF